MAHEVDQPRAPASWRRPMFIWPLAWFVMGVGLMIGDVFSRPPQGPFWVALGLGALGWGAAGGYSGPTDRTSWSWPLGLAWALLFPPSLLVGLRWAEFVEYPLGGPGVLGLGAALGLGGAVGGLLTGISAPNAGLRATTLVRGLIAFAFFGALFFIASCAGMLGCYLLPGLVEGLLGGLLGETAAVKLGFGLGWAVGGLLAGAAVTSTREESIGV